MEIMHSADKVRLTFVGNNVNSFIDLFYNYVTLGQRIIYNPSFSSYNAPDVSTPYYRMCNIIANLAECFSDRLNSLIDDDNLGRNQTFFDGKSFIGKEENNVLTLSLSEANINTLLRFLLLPDGQLREGASATALAVDIDKTLFNWATEVNQYLLKMMAT